VVTQSVITNNTGSFSGSGIENSGVATLSHSLIANNEADAGDGGGIANFGKLTLIDSTALSNRALFCDESRCGPPRGGMAAGFSMLAVLPTRA
jgi:hypothetical protein